MNAVRVTPSSHPRYGFEVTAPAHLFGRRVRKYFRTKTAANDYRVILETKLSRSRLAPLNRDVHLIAARYQGSLSPAEFETALAAAVHTTPAQPLSALADLYLARQRSAQSRGAVGSLMVRELDSRVPRLVVWLGDPLVSDIGETMVTRFIDARLSAGAAPRTVRNYLADLSAMLRLAVDRGWLPVGANPVPKVSPPKSRGTVSIVAPKELSPIIKAADPVTLRWIMFGAFAGLRTSETGRLVWGDIRLDEGQLYVSPGKTKNAERWVELLPPLVVWLEASLPKSPKDLVLEGHPYKELKRGREATYKRAGNRVPHNALRHSYGSHHLVEFNNPHKTALEMGHHSPQQTFAAYRRAVTKKQAARYWGLRVIAPSS